MNLFKKLKTRIDWKQTWNDFSDDHEELSAFLVALFIVAVVLLFIFLCCIIPKIMLWTVITVIVCCFIWVIKTFSKYIKRTTKK